MRSEWRDARSLATSSPEADTIESVPLGHIRQDDLVAFLEPLDHLNLAHRTAAQLHLRADGVARAGEAEDADRAALLAERRATQLEHVDGAFELDGAVDAQIGHGAARQRLGERHIG